jgi:parallel beta-helix repeat protein
MRPFLVLLALLLATAISADDLRFTAVPPDEISAEAPATWRFTLENVSGEDRPATRMWFSLGPGTITSLPPELDCAYDRADLYCMLPALAAGESIAFEASVQHPFRYGRTHARVSVSYVPGEPETLSGGRTYWKEFPVTTAADSGPGSLRQTILAINAAPECQNRYPIWPTPCKAAFRIEEEVPAEGWYTVRPLTPLPVVRAYDAAIDGSTQTGPNTLGPNVALDGSALAAGDGISAATIGAFEVSGLAIGGFPGDGIHGAVHWVLSVHHNYIGVDPTGRRAHPNAGRGVVSAIMRGVIAHNVIGGNGRSGIWFAPKGEGTGPTIARNRIGVGAHDDTPIGNGASGIFIGDFRGYYAYPTIEGNVIANNAHFGVALTANSPMLILGNSIRDNGGGGIDIDLDGPTESKRGVPGVQGGVVPPPVILSARYANGVTTITGYSTAGNQRRQVVLYANDELEPDGYAEGEQFLGITPLLLFDNHAFTFVYPGDLRGKYINGTSSAVTFWGWDEYSYTSSEFGRAVAVVE